MDQRHRWMVHGKLEKKALLVAINSLAGLSIFFFGKLVQNMPNGRGGGDGKADAADAPKATTRG